MPPMPCIGARRTSLKPCSRSDRRSRMAAVDSRRLIASGRDADIFDLGGGRALRESRDGRTIEPEARLMAFLADHDYPIPIVHEVRADGSEIVMDLVDGRLMADAITRRPWAMARYASVLADLHDQLHDITAPGWLTQSRAWRAHRRGGRAQDPRSEHGARRGRGAAAAGPPDATPRPVARRFR
jgi:hypothetical protein